MAAFFEWDPVKDAENRRRHGVSFAEAQLAFLDPCRVIGHDTSHSRHEARFYGFGRVAGRVMTVRFTVRGARARGFMRKPKGYTEERIGPVAIIRDFLPPPDQLILRDDGVKVTISLSRRSVDFFKAHARKSGVPYQRMIRRVLDEYAGHHSHRSRRA